jgi:predicted metal-dependent hydrolase
MTAEPVARAGGRETTAVARLAGGPLPYILRQSPRSRRLRVTIDPLRGVIVTVPLPDRRGWRRPNGEVDAFLAEREPWVRRHLVRAERARLLVPATGDTLDGATLRFRGERHRIRLVNGAAGRSRVTREGGVDGDELVVGLAARDRRPPERVLREWLVERARTAIEREIDRHAGPLGVAPKAVTLRDPRTRWGSASRHGRLSFSWRLVLAPPDALETVVVHELAHLRVFGHGPRFWELVATRRPDHRVWRRWLREHSLELHAALN